MDEEEIRLALQDLAVALRAAKQECERAAEQLGEENAPAAGRFGRWAAALRGEIPRVDGLLHARDWLTAEPDADGEAVHELLEHLQGLLGADLEDRFLEAVQERLGEAREAAGRAQGAPAEIAEAAGQIAATVEQIEGEVRSAAAGRPGS